MAFVECIGVEAIGEYGRGVLEGENDDTCRSMTNSCVELVRATILERRSGKTACEEPWVLMKLDNFTTIYDEGREKDVSMGITEKRRS